MLLMARIAGVFPSTEELSGTLWCDEDCCAMYYAYPLFSFNRALVSCWASAEPALLLASIFDLFRLLCLRWMTFCPLTV